MRHSDIARVFPPAKGQCWASAGLDRCRRVSDTVLLWLERRRQRRALGGLSDHMLKDLGLSRSDAGRESGKRFWEG
jgi:uncharacterized protein YjiS (DUF1127 family)